MCAVTGVVVNIVTAAIDGSDEDTDTQHPVTTMSLIDCPVSRRLHCDLIRHTPPADMSPMLGDIVQYCRLLTSALCLIVPKILHKFTLKPNGKCNIRCFHEKAGRR